MNACREESEAVWAAEGLAPVICGPCDAVLAAGAQGEGLGGEGPALGWGPSPGREGGAGRASRSADCRQDRLQGWVTPQGCSAPPAPPHLPGDTRQGGLCGWMRGCGPGAGHGWGVAG